MIQEFEASDGPAKTKFDIKEMRSSQSGVSHALDICFFATAELIAYTELFNPPQFPGPKMTAPCSVHVMALFCFPRAR